MKRRRDFYLPGVGRIRTKPVVKGEFYIEGEGGEKMGDETEAKSSLSGKICPILTGFKSIGKDCITAVECVKHDCAILDYVTQQCAFLEIAFELRDIGSAIRKAT